MKTSLGRRLLAGSGLWLALSSVAAFAYLTDGALHRPPNYYSFAPPHVNASYTDPVFGTSVKRITDAMNTPNDVGVGNLTYITNEYSTMSPFNMDNTRLILQHESYYGLYDGSGRFLRDLPFDVYASSEPRWSRKDPNLLYFINGNTLLKLDVESEHISTIHVFGEYDSVSGHGESDISFDGDHFVLVGDDRDVFVYEISSDSKGPVFNNGGRGFDSVYITPDNHVTITWLEAGTKRYNGIELYDQDMTFLRQATHAGGHMDVTRDTNGDEVLVWINSADPLPIANCENGIVKVRLADGHQTCLAQFDWSLSVHVSAPDKTGWLFMETYDDRDPNPDDPTWHPYTGEILQVKLDGSQTRRLLHHRSRPFNDYYYEPRASVSHDGTKLVFSSNYGLQAQIGYPNDYGDVYLVTVPGGDPQLPPTSSSPEPHADKERFEQTADIVDHHGVWSTNQRGVHSGGSAVRSRDAESQARLHFKGRAVRWIGYHDPSSGIGEVYLDGRHVATVDTYSSREEAQAVLFVKTDLPPGKHVLSIRPTGRGNPQSDGAWVWVDAFDVAR